MDWRDRLAEATETDEGPRQAEDRVCTEILVPAMEAIVEQLLRHGLDVAMLVSPEHRSTRVSVRRGETEGRFRYSLKVIAAGPGRPTQLARTVHDGDRATELSLIAPGTGRPLPNRLAPEQTIIDDFVEQYVMFWERMED